MKSSISLLFRGFETDLVFEMASAPLLHVAVEVDELSKAWGNAVKIALTSSDETFSEGSDGT